MDAVFEEIVEIHKGVMPNLVLICGSAITFAGAIQDLVKEEEAQSGGNEPDKITAR